MPNTFLYDQLELADSEPLGNAENRLLVWAVRSVTANVPTAIKGSDFMWCTFGVVSQLAFTFSCEGSMVGSFATFDTLFTLPIVAATYTEPYALAAPKGDSGFVVLPRPWIRFRALDTAGGAHTYTRIYIRVWSP